MVMVVVLTVPVGIEPVAPDTLVDAVVFAADVVVVLAVYIVLVANVLGLAEIVAV